MKWTLHCYFVRRPNRSTVLFAICVPNSWTTKTKERANNRNFQPNMEQFTLWLIFEWKRYCTWVKHAHTHTQTGRGNEIERQRCSKHIWSFFQSATRVRTLNHIFWIDATEWWKEPESAAHNQSIIILIFFLLLTTSFLNHSVSS